MKAKYLELQNDMDTLQKEFEKMTSGSSGSSNSKSGKPQTGSTWTSGWRKLSKLTKINNAEGQDLSGAHGTGPSEQGRKGPRRWRNSIS